MEHGSDRSWYKNFLAVTMSYCSLLLPDDEHFKIFRSQGLVP